MSDPDPDFRCTAASSLRGESAAGTASTVRAYLLLEHPGAWGVDALADARLPDGLGRRLQAVARSTGVRVLLVRRPGRRTSSGADAGRRRVFAAYADPVRPRLEGGTVADLRDVLDLDLAGLGAGRSSGLDPTQGSLFCVCTHGRHDACCAERGRPVAGALSLVHPEETWEVSHIGGDRFAGNLLVLPHGLYYGRLEAATAAVTTRLHLAGELDLDRLRGRSGLAMPVQAAEIALRRQLGERREGAVRLVGRSTNATVTTARFDVLGASYVVVVRSTPDPTPRQLTCRAATEHAALRHEVLEVGREVS